MWKASFDAGGGGAWTMSIAETIAAVESVAANAR